MTAMRYPRALVALHWLVAVLVIFSLLAGKLLLEPTPNSDPFKVSALFGHMIFGGLIGVLILVRLVVRLRSDVPPAANALAPVVHWALYGLVILMVASGITMSVYFGLPAIVFGGTGTLPENFDSIGARAVHGLASGALIALVVVHIVAGLYHAVIKKDGVMARMSLRR